MWVGFAFFTLVLVPSCLSRCHRRLNTWLSKNSKKYFSLAISINFVSLCLVFGLTSGLSVNELFFNAVEIGSTTINSTAGLLMNLLTIFTLLLFVMYRQHLLALLGIDPDENGGILK